MFRNTFVLAKRILHNNKFGFLQTKFTDQLMKDLKLEYKVNPSLHIFRQYITSNSDYFRIFQMIEREPFSEQCYNQMREETAKLKHKNDNMLLLRAKLCARIAENLASQNKTSQADKMYNEALEIMEQSLVPQVLQFYSIYRKYGFFLWAIGSNQKAAQVLSQSVEIIKQYVANSEDPVTANYNSLEQAKACVKLIYLQPSQRQKWVRLANSYWKQCQSGVYDQIQYAQTVYENCRDRSKVNKKSGRLYAQLEMEKIKNQKYHSIIEKALEQDKK